MGNKYKDLVDYFLIHQHYLGRYATNEVNVLLMILDAANADIKALILRAKSIDTKKQYARAAAEIRAITKQLSEQLYGQLHFDFEELAAEEIALVAKSLRGAGLTADLGLEHISPQRIWAAASFGTYAGPDSKFTFKKYVDSLSNDVFNTWDIACRSAYLTGTPAKTIVRNVLGKISTEGMEPGQVQRLRNSLDANTRTMISSLASTARNSVYRENEQYFTGFKYLATLDFRSCAICFRDDGRIFKTLDKVPTLPRHLNCRCVVVPYIKGFEDIPSERAASVLYYSFDITEPPRALRIFRRRSSEPLVHLKLRPDAFHDFMYSFIAFINCATDSRLSRRILLFVISANHRSIMLSHDEWVGIKCVTNLPSREAMYSFTSFVVCVE